MQTENRFFDDLARVAGGALGSLADARSELETRLKQQFKQILEEMELVNREEFNAVKAMASKARKEQLSLEKRIVVLEKALGINSKLTKSSSVRSPSDKGKISTGKRKSKTQ